jgi:hypothetical protein
MDHQHTGQPQDLGRELEIDVHCAALLIRFDSEAGKLLGVCRTREEYQNRIEDTFDVLLGREPRESEPGLYRDLAIEIDDDGNLSVSYEPDPEVSDEAAAAFYEDIAARLFPSSAEVGAELAKADREKLSQLVVRMSKARAASEWAMKADFRCAVEERLGPVLEVHRRSWLRRFEQRSEQVAVVETVATPTLGASAPAGHWRKRIVQTEADRESRSEARIRWLDQLLSDKGWSSDVELAGKASIAYNTVVAYRSGKSSTRAGYVRLQLAKAAGCPVDQVPK